MELIKDDIDFTAYAEEPEQHKVRAAGDYLNETIAAFYPPPDVAPPPRPLWDKCNGKIAFRPGEVSLWAGINGHGKSMFLSQVELDLMMQGERVLSLSFEMLPVRQMQRMARQAYADELPPVPFLRTFHEWTNGRLWMYDHNGAIKWETVMSVCRYAQEQFGIKQFVIDSLMKCVKGDTDYDAQKDFVNELCSFAQARKVHVHLVHHVRKGEDEDRIPGKFDAKGAGTITDMVDNVFIVWRNKKAERGDNTDQKPTAMLRCDKQRNGEWEGLLGFWFQMESMQYLERFDAVPMRYSLG
ncbi:MAG: AAA family ATPase [Bacillota bacterium]